MTYIIPPKPEEIRQAMIGYHEQSRKSAESFMDNVARTQRDKNYWRAVANTHNEMIDFWKHVFIGSIKDLLSTQISEQEGKTP